MSMSSLIRPSRIVAISMLLLYPSVEAVYKGVGQSLVHFSYSVPRDLAQSLCRRRLGRGLTAGIAASCLWFGEGTLQFLHTWPDHVLVQSSEHMKAISTDSEYFLTLAYVQQ